MSTMTRNNRRWTDRAPLTSRMGWAFWRAVNRIERISAVDAVCFCCVGVIYGGGMWVVAQWMLGA